MSLLTQKYSNKNTIIKCFFYKNVHEIPKLNKATLSFTKKNDFFLKTLVKFSTFFELITKQRSFFIRAKKSSVLLKIRKGNPIGVKITLRKKFLNHFLFNLVWKVLPSIKSLFIKTNFFKNKSKKETLTIIIPSILSFSELQPFFFFFKNFKNLKILFSFSKKIKKKELFFNCRFLKLPIN